MTVFILYTFYFILNFASVKGKDFKQYLLAVCKQLVGERVAQSEKAMKAAQEAANNEEKSSMGDKYETSRAMSHNERDMSARQLVEAKIDLDLLSQIDSEKIYTAGARGACVVSETYIFFIAAGIGLVKVDEQQVFVVSPKAPLAASLIGKKAGDSFLFKNEKLVIDYIF